MAMMDYLIFSLLIVLLIFDVYLVRKCNEKNNLLLKCNKLFNVISSKLFSIEGKIINIDSKTTILLEEDAKRNAKNRGNK